MVTMPKFFKAAWEKSLRAAIFWKTSESIHPSEVRIWVAGTQASQKKRQSEDVMPTVRFTGPNLKAQR
jgi:hypothetical protein